MYNPAMLTRHKMRMAALIGFTCCLFAAVATAGDRAPTLLPPIEEPEVFALGSVSLLGNAYRDGEVNLWPDGNRLIFSRFGPGIPDFTIFESWLVDGAWTKPEPTRLFEDSLASEPGLAPDGRAIFFTPPTTGIHGTHDIYAIEESDAGWSEPRRLFRGLYPSLTCDRTIYYTAYVGWKDHIAYRRFVDGEYGPQQLIEAPVYSVYEDAHPCVAPDDSYVIFDSSRPRESACYLFISFHNDDGTWTEPVNMGSALGDLPAALARISPDGEILFFKANGEVYWIHTDALDALR